MAWGTKEFLSLLVLHFGKEQPSTEQGTLVADDSVQGVAGIVSNVQQFV